MRCQQTLFSTKKSNWKLSVKPLQNHLHYLGQALVWLWEAFGKETLSPLEFMEDLRCNTNKFNLVFYNKQAIGMFRLDTFHLEESRFNVLELTDVVIDSHFRNLGFGREMIAKAKEVAGKKKADMVVLETANPQLNRFYEKCGAKVVCENHFRDHLLSEVTFLRM